MRWKYLFVHLTTIVEKYVKDRCVQYNIDHSHNLDHSRQVACLGLTIANHDYSLTKRQYEILYLSCMLHDMIDSKYVPREQSIMDLTKFLQTDCGLTMLTIEPILEIITSMSYSRIVKPDGLVEYPLWLEYDDYHCKDIFHITREADLLTSYDIKRMAHYKCEKLGFLTPQDIYHDILDTAQKRMRKLLEKKLFVSPSAKKLATMFHDEMEDQLSNLKIDDICGLLQKEPEDYMSFQTRVIGCLNNKQNKKY